MNNNNKTILLKEINYTKYGTMKGNGQKQKNIYSLIKSLEHSLRLNDKSNNVDEEKEHLNDYDKFGKTREERQKKLDNLINFIEKNTEKKSIDDKKIDKKVSNVKSKLRKRFQCNDDIFDLIDNNESLNIEDMYILIKDKFKYNPTKDFMIKQSIDQIQNYIDSKKEKDKLEKHTYTNQTLMRELIFKIPVKNEINFNEVDRVQITNYLDTFYKGYEYDLITHDDESNLHFHVFIKGWDKDNNFNLNQEVDNNIIDRLHDNSKEILKNCKNKKEEKRFFQTKQQQFLLNRLNKSYNENKFYRKEYSSTEEKNLEIKTFEKDTSREVSKRKYNNSTLKLERNYKKIEESNDILTTIKTDIDQGQGTLIELNKNIEKQTNLINDSIKKLENIDKIIDKNIKRFENIDKNLSDNFKIEKKENIEKIEILKETKKELEEFPHTPKPSRGGISR